MSSIFIHSHLTKLLYNIAIWNYGYVMFNSYLWIVQYNLNDFLARGQLTNWLDKSTIGGF